MLSQNISSNATHSMCSPLNVHATKSLGPSESHLSLTLAVVRMILPQVQVAISRCTQTEILVYCYSFSWLHTSVFVWTFEFKDAKVWMSHWVQHFAGDAPRSFLTSSDGWISTLWPVLVVYLWYLPVVACS